MVLHLFSSLDFGTESLKRRMDNIEFVRKEVWACKITETTKIQRLIGNSQQMMQG
jgi:hypothetical protein